MIKQNDAKKAILMEWYKLPEKERETEHQAAVFALKMIKERPDITNFRFRGDHYQIIKGWLCNYLSIPDR